MVLHTRAYTYTRVLIASVLHHLLHRLRFLFSLLARNLTWYQVKMSSPVSVVLVVVPLTWTYTGASAVGEPLLSFSRWMRSVYATTTPRCASNDGGAHDTASAASVAAADGGGAGAVALTARGGADGAASSVVVTDALEGGLWSAPSLATTKTV